MKKVSKISIYGIIFFLSCIPIRKNTKAEIDYCEKIDLLVYERYVRKGGNFFINEIIPQIEQKSNIESSCEKGMVGYICPSDSLFDNDIKKWREYFHCK